MPERKKDSLAIVVAHFKDAGYVIEMAIPGSIQIEPTERGQSIRCIDPRVDSKTSPDSLGPAVPGGVFGLAFLMEDSKRSHGILAKLDRAMQRVIESGFVPSTHGDHIHGEVKGCKLLYALTQRAIPGIDLTEGEIMGAITANGINHKMLRGTANPIGFAVNFNPDSTIIQKREKFATDAWYLDELGLNPEQYSPKLVVISNLILPPERRRLIVAT